MIKAAVLFMVTIFCGLQIHEVLNGPEAELRKLDFAWSKAVASKSLDQTMAFYAPDAVTAGSAMFPAYGAADFQKQWSSLFLQPDYALSWKMERVIVTKSGTIAYTSGSWRSGDGNGPYIAVWQKQNDGQWKVIIDAAWEEERSRQTP